MISTSDNPANKLNDESASHANQAEHPLIPRIIFSASLAAILVILWIPFDFLIDPLNSRTFLILRIICAMVILSGLVAFIRAGKPVQSYRKFSLLIYLTGICTLLPMPIMTEEKFPYYIGFSTLFFAVSVLMIWPLRYFLIPMLMTGLVIGTFEWHALTDLKMAVTGIFLTLNVSLMSGLASWLTYQNFTRNEMLLMQLETLSNTDRLTGLNNRRYFDLRLNDELAHAARNHASIAVMLLDIDHFKKYNDNYGHLQGDECLRQVAACLRKTLTREIDFVARYGGEEFVIVLPNSNIKGAEIMANRIIDAMYDQKIPHAYSPAASFVTISIGIVCCEEKPQTKSAAMLLAAADSALYKAKENGRNQFAVA